MGRPRKKRAKKGAPVPKKTRWELSADRENDRRRKKAPLFVHAGLVALATAEEREARFGDAYREQIEREDQERKAAEEARGEEFRAKVRALVTPEKFAELEGRVHRYPSAAYFYRGILDELTRPEPEAGPTSVPAPPRRPLPIVQGALFVEVPGKGAVPAVVDGHAVPLQRLAEEHGVDLSAPEKRKPEPCPDCGWFPRPGAALDFHVHPTSCPSLRAFLLGLSENCAACKALHKEMAGAPYPSCPEHLERARACARDGTHLPGPPRKNYLADSGNPLSHCTRCGIHVSNEPTFPARAA